VPPPTVEVKTPVTSNRARSELSRRLGDQPGVFWGAVAACVAMGVGAIGTWATALGFISVAGTSGEDGDVVLGVAVLGLLALWARTRRGAVWPAIAAALCGAVGGGISGVDLHKLSGIGTSEFFGRQVRLVHPGWGIYLAVGAGAALILLSIAVIIIGDERPVEQSELGSGDRDGPLAVGIGSVVLALSVGAVVAVANVGTHNSPQQTASAPASAVPTETTTAAEPSTETTQATTTETSSTATSSSQPLEVVQRYWEDVGAHNYTGAYAYLAPRASGLSKSQFISSEKHAGIEHVSFRGNAGTTSGTDATVEVESLTTEDHEFGCRTWSGSYELTERAGTWLIQKAAISPQPCS
jgi:hypothetical protein